MEIRDYNYFDSQKVTESRSVANHAVDQDFDLDLQTMNRPPRDSHGPEVQGSGHFWCHPTDHGCTVIVSLLICGEQQR